jgi:hypothetical protein
MKIQFANGRIVEFDSDPSSDDIDYVARQVFAAPPLDDAPKDEWDRYYKATVKPVEPSLLETEVSSPLRSALSTGLTAGIAKESMSPEMKSAIFPEQKTLPGKIFRGGAELTAMVAGLPGRATISGVKALSQAIPKVIVPAEKLAGATLGRKIATGVAGGAIGGATLAPQDMSKQKYIENIAVGAATGAAIPAIGSAVIDRFPALQSNDGLKRRISEKVQEGIWKAFRPSMIGKKTIGQIERFDNKASSAVADIIANKDKQQFIDEVGNVKGNQLPENMADTAKAIEDGRKRIFSEYNALTQQAGESGAIVDVKNLQSIIEKYATDPVLEVENPTLFNFANRQYQALGMRQRFTPLEAEQKIAEWNSDLKNQYKSGDFGVETNKVVLKEMVESLRKDLDSSINSATGSKAYQSLKNQYGAYRALADEIGRRLPVTRRASPSGFFDVADAFASGDILSGGIGILSGDASAPARIARGIGINVGKTILKRRNDPNLIIGNMFKDVDALLQEQGKRSSGGVAIGEKGKQIISRKGEPIKLRGLNIEDVSPKGSQGNKGEVIISRKGSNPQDFKTAEEYVASKGGYFRYSNSKTGASDVPWQMFSNNESKVNTGYGKNAFIADNNGAVKSTDIEQDIINALDKHPEIIRELQSSSKEIAKEAHPKDIVDSAGLWDNPDVVQIIWDEVLEPKGIIKVKTPDGLIVFDPAEVMSKSQLTSEFNAAKAGNK